MNTKCIIMSGLSGAGKTTIIEAIAKQRPDIEKVITSTTRPIRPGEKNGVHYYFYCLKDFEKMIQNDEFFETTTVYSGKENSLEEAKHYGSEKVEVNRILNSGHIPVFVCDIKGAETLSEKLETSVSIFLMPDSIENLKSRLKNREGSTPNDIKLRLQNIEEEIERSKMCDYIVINREGQLEDAVKEVLNIIDRETNENKESSIEISENKLK